MKSSPISIRFDQDKLDFIREREKLTTHQKVVDFLLDAYWWQNRLGKVEVKHEQPIKKEAPEPPKISPYEAYLTEIKDAGSPAEIQKIVSVSSKDFELSQKQRETIKNYGIEISRTID
jgi:hypothetical protein